MLGGRCHVAMALCALGALGCHSNTVVDGHVRFQVLTPSLIRLEYADDRHFEDGITFNRTATPFAPVRFTSRVRNEWLEVETDEVQVRYLLGSGPFTHDNLTVTMLKRHKTVAPFGQLPAHPVSGWLRALDAQRAEVALHPGLLNLDGWFLLDDTWTSLRDRDGWIKVRPAHRRDYQDQYLFAYDQDYRQALSDLARLTGPPPLLPRWAFGVWFSRYFPYSQAAYHDELLPRFRQEEVPLDVLVVDTDWKAPRSDGTVWNSWAWNRQLFPDATSFLRWGGKEGLHVALNIHPSMHGSDPYFATANQAAGELSPIADGNFSWDWGNPTQADAYFKLHEPFEDQGVRFWWLDWCCENAFVSTPGAPPKAEWVPPDGWINWLYADRATRRGLRGFAFSRIGGRYRGHSAVDSSSTTGPWPDRRTTIHFTGDTFPTWEMLRFEVGFTVAEGATGFSYVSHDIGSFFGKHLTDDLYLRWLQLGVFQPIMRLHSHHGDRLPWDYDDATRLAADKLLRLRESLIPYLYTLAREAYDTGLPLARGLFLYYPNDDHGWEKRNSEYFLGDALLVVPITAPDGNVLGWIPPGTWINIFTGEQLVGPAEQLLHAGLDSMLVFARAGAIVPRQPPMNHVGERPVDPLLLDVYAGADGSFTLYEDEGEGLGYLAGKLQRVAMRYADASHELSVEPASGHYDGAPTQRAYVVSLFNMQLPARVLLDGNALPAGAWRYDAARRALTVEVPAHAVDKRLVLHVE